MSGLGGLAIVLVIVIWLFVLAPVLLRDQERIRQTDTGFEKTRVLYQGNSGSVPSARRVAIAAQSKAAQAQEDTSAADSGLVDDDVEVLSPSSVADPVETDSSSNPADDDIVNAEVVEDVVVEGVTELPGDEAASDQVDASAAHSPAHSGTEDIAKSEVSSTVQPFDETDAEAYLEPEDLLYRDPHHPSPEVHIQEVEEDVDEEDLTRGMDELTAEEIAFAKTRSQRGSWDPEKVQAKSATTYQRRQRTLLALLGFLVIAIAAGFIMGGWSWLATGIVLAISTVYVVALRKQVREEENLRQRRIYQLRRRMNGVLNAQDEELFIDRQYHYPGAEVVQRDDEDFDFVDVPLYDAANNEGVDDNLCAMGERYAS